MATERTGVYFLHGNPLTLVGDEIQVGQKAPAFRLTDNGFSPVTQAVLAGKVGVLVVVPSLDTPVCARETKRFHDELAAFGDRVVTLVISMDLPYAQKRWCGDNGAMRVKALSDHLDAGFGLSYGVLTKELRLLARSVFVLDRQGVVRYTQLVREFSEEPDYGPVLAAIRTLAG
jgi:thiol peroxidase